MPKQKMKELKIVVKHSGGAKMFHLFGHKATSPRKVKFYSPDLEYAIIFRDGALENIKKTKGWKSDSEMAKNLGLTKQYISNLRHRRSPCTHTVVTRIAAITGNIQDNWHVFYELKPIGFIRTNECQYNQEKYLGQIPYEKYSPMAELRKADHAVEVKS